MYFKLAVLHILSYVLKLLFCLFFNYFLYFLHFFVLLLITVVSSILQQLFLVLETRFELEMLDSLKLPVIYCWFDSSVLYFLKIFI